MKRALLIIALFASLTSFSAPWDIQSKHPRAFTDPYITGCFSAEISKNYQPNHAVQIQVTFNQSVPVPYYVVVSVLGNWSTAPGYATERYFTILFPTGSYRKVVNYPMASTEETYDENTYVSDYGPQ